MKIKKSKKTNANKVIPLLLVVSMINTMFLPITATAKTIEDVKPVVVGSVPMGYVGGSIDTVEDTSHLNFANSKTRARASLPQSYNMMNEGKITTRIEDQARTSNCWAFSSLGSVESSIFSQLNDIDLSERHLAYFATVGKNNLLDPADGTNGDIFTPSLGSSWQNCGGNYQITTATLTRGVGPLLESKAPYNDPLTEPDAKLEFAKPDVFIKDGFRLPNKDVNGTLDGTHIKQTLMNNSSVMVSYGALMSQFYDAQVTYPTYYSSYTQDDFPSGDIGGHAVQIIGWDDTISKDKFTDFQRQTSKPSVDGAWIIKNSWGENSLGSIFYMSYDTKCMSSFYAYKATDDKNLMYDNNYQYDGVGALRTFNLPGVNTEYMANVFTAKGNETLESVSINTASHNQPYTISIYKGMQDTTNPTSGTKVHEQSGTATYSGYHNIKLNNSNAINFAADEKFIVVVKFVESDNADLGTMCFEYEYSNFSEATMKAGESFISSDGIYWGDAKDNAVQSNIPIGNICIKAFTDNIKPNTFSNWTDIANSAQKDTDYTENKNSLTIKTATGLAWFAKSVNDGNGYQGKTVSLENNVDLDTGLVVGYDKAVTEDNSWIPIGKDSSPFKGIFDGKGFEISGIKINNNLNRQGLFGNILGDASIKASISNLGIVSADIIGGEFTGSIVGSGFNVIMYDCYNKSTTTKSSSVTGKSLVGGLAGELQDSTMQNCYNTGKVMLSTEDGVAGGLIGRITKESIINCFNAGEITTTESTSATNIQKGGIIGQIINATAKNCYYLNTTENSFADSNEGIITATKMTVEEMQDTTFVDTLNKNLDEFDNTGLHLWKAVSRDYPTLDFENYWKITLLPENFKFTEPTNLYFNNDPKIAGVEFNDSIIGAGTVTVNYYKGSTKLASEPTDVGTYTVKVDVTKGIHYEAVTDLEVGTFTISYIKSPSLSMFT
ncbi:MAG: lectin like domain-containing protein, partial [Oscillospiraceae bacterium]